MKTAWIKKYSLDWPTPFYVLLLAAFPVLFLYSYNINEIEAGQLVLPLAACLAGAFLLWILLTLVLRDGRKAGLAVALFLAFFFSYGRLYESLEGVDVFILRHAYFLPGLLLVWGYGVYFISRAKRDFRTSTTVLNIIAAVLIIINLANITFYQVNKPGLGAKSPVSTAGAAATLPDTGQNLPDIYFIILDEYAPPDVIKEWCGYDNSPFIKGLEDKGFVIAEHSKARSPYTPEAIAQVLNMEYLTAGVEWDKTAGWVGGETKDYGNEAWSESTYHKIAYNKAADFLRSKGYKYIYFGCWAGLNLWDKYMKDNADLYFNYYGSDSTNWVNEFQHILWKTTMIGPAYYQATGGLYNNIHRIGVLNTLKHLKEMPHIAGPKFVFVHVLPPHEPFVFGSRGEVIASANYENYKDKQVYRDQYIFITREIEKVVDALLKESKSPPIIIIQSDHGLRPHHPGIVIGTKEWHKILNALYLPGLDKAVLYDSISQVNTFRLIFNRYFGTNYELLPDD
jgi:hypothetical protein